MKFLTFIKRWIRHSNLESGMKGFTLLEVLVATVLLLVLLQLTISIISASQKTLGKASAQVQQFRSARQAFDAASGRLSQAILNPYWQVTLDSQGTPQRYERASELRFISGPVSRLVPGSAKGGGSAVFFQAPTGFSSDGLGNLGNGLNTWGYFVEYGSDLSYRPAFLNGVNIPERRRFRLVEFLDPIDTLALFDYTSGNSDYTGKEWFTNPLAEVGQKRVLAENIIAFVVMPRLSNLDDPTGVALSPDLEYDSTTRFSDPLLNPRNQLPPILEVAIVAFDERTASRLDWGISPPDFDVDLDSLFRDAEKLDEDLEVLRGKLVDKGLDARIFRQTVTLVSSRWSNEQKN